MWPGSDIGFDNPDYVVKFNGTMGTKEKMDITLGWIDLPFEERPQMISVYIPQIDQEGHRGGPNGSKMNTFLQEVDDALGYFLRQLMERNLLEHVNIVIVKKTKKHNRFFMLNIIVIGERPWYVRDRRIQVDLL